MKFLTIRPTLNIAPQANVENNVAGSNSSAQDPKKIALQQRDRLFSLSKDLHSPANAGNHPRKVEILGEMAQLMGQVDNKKSVESIVRTLNHRKNRFLFGDAQSKAWAHSSKQPTATEFQTINMQTATYSNNELISGTNRSFDAFALYPRQSSSWFATDHERAFNEILGTLRPQMPQMHQNYLVPLHPNEPDLRGYYVPDPNLSPIHATAGEIERRIGLAPAWNGQIATIHILKPERQKALIAALNGSLDNLPSGCHQQVVQNMGSTFSTLLRQFDALSPALQDQVHTVIGRAKRYMNDEQKQELAQTFSASSLISDQRFAFLGSTQSAVAA